jgi:WD40 repeat protein
MSRGVLVASALAIAVVWGPSSSRCRAEDDKQGPLPSRALIQIGTEELRARDPISSIVYSPDGRMVAVADVGMPRMVVSLFDVGTGRLAKRLALPDQVTNRVLCLAFSPDGTKLAWGELDGSVALWDVPAARPMARRKLHQGMLKGVAFSPDGRSIASGGTDGIVHLRGVETFSAEPGLDRKDAGPADRDFVEPRSQVNCLAFTADGDRLVVGTSTDVWARISIYRVADGQRLRTIDKVHGPLDKMINVNPIYLAVTPDGRRILSSGVRDRPAKQGETTRPLASEIRIWDIEMGERIREWRDEEHHWLANFVLSRDGRLVIAPSRDALRIVDAATFRTERAISLPGCERVGLALSPDGTILAASVSNAIYLFDVQTGRRRLQDDAMPAREWRAVAWSPAGDRIVTAHDDGIVRVWDAATGRPVWYRPLATGPAGPVGAYIPGVAFSADGHRVIVAGNRHDRMEDRPGLLAVYNAADGAVIREIRCEGFGKTAFSPDGRMVFTEIADRSRYDLMVVGLETDTGREVWRTLVAKANEWMAHSVAFIHAVNFRDDTRVVEVATTKYGVTHYDAGNGRERRQVRLEPPAGDHFGGRVSLHGAAFNADGRLLVADTYRRIAVWDAETGRLRHQLPYPANYIHYILALSPDGRSVVLFTGYPGPESIRVYDLETGREAFVLQPRDDRTHLLALSPDGTRLLTGLGRSTGIVWDVSRAPARRQ